jgi:hypothetical protein
MTHRRHFGVESFRWLPPPTRLTPEDILCQDRSPAMDSRPLIAGYSGRRISFHRCPIVTMRKVTYFRLVALWSNTFAREGNSCHHDLILIRNLSNSKDHSDKWLVFI